jgi:hypothetical protein
MLWGRLASPLHNHIPFGGTGVLLVILGLRDVGPTLLALNCRLFDKGI